MAASPWALWSTDAHPSSSDGRTRLWCTPETKAKDFREFCWKRQNLTRNISEEVTVWLTQKPHVYQSVCSVIFIRQKILKWCQRQQIFLCILRHSCLFYSLTLQNITSCCEFTQNKKVIQGLSFFFLTVLQHCFLWQTFSQNSSLMEL